MFSDQIKRAKLLVEMLKEMLYFVPLAYRATVKANRIGILTGREAAAFELSSGMHYMHITRNTKKFSDIDGKLAMNMNDFWHTL